MTSVINSITLLKKCRGGKDVKYVEEYDDDDVGTTVTPMDTKAVGTGMTDKDRDVS